MRLKLSLIPLNPGTAIPINYNYPLAAAVYRFLAQASPDYAEWLHNHGYRSPAARRMKMFTFSRLNIPGVRVKDNTLQAGNERPWQLFIGSPMEDDFVQHFVIGLFTDQTLEVGGPGAVGRFLIESVETLAPPAFKPRMAGKTLSPLVSTTMREHHGKLQAYYYRPTDPEVGEALRRNLIAKYEIVHGEPCRAPDFTITFDMGYYQRRGGKVSKLLHIKEGQAAETRIKAFEMPFAVQGNPELLQIAWECGLGDKNSLGLGMVELW